MSDQPVSIMRLPITVPCPVKVVAGTGETVRGDEPIPMSERTEYCAVDASWMIGAQVCCDIHMRIPFDQGWLNGSFEELVRETYEPFGADAVARNLALAARPWAERKRYSQEDAARWDDSTTGDGPQAVAPESQA